MKKRITFILIGILLVNSFLYLFLFQYFIHSLKGRFEEDNEELLKKVNYVIKIDKSQLGEINFVDKKEFIYKGRLYDIIERKYEGDKIIFLCYHDKEEEEAYSEHNDYLKKKKGQNRSSFTYFSFNAVFYKAVPDYNTFNTSNNFKIFTSGYLSNIPDIPSPPPKKSLFAI